MSTLLALVILAVIHLFANQAKVMGLIWHGRFLSFASGISFAYVFIDLLPKLEAGQPVLKAAFEGTIPYLDRHSYLIALFGVLFSYGLQSPSGKSMGSFLLSMAGYALFNIFVGASLADEHNPDIQPISLFTIAIGLHYFVHDHNLQKDHPQLYQLYGRYILTLSLAIGYLIGFYINIPETIIAIIVAFFAGGVLLNVMRFELPQKSQGTYIYFVLGSLIYSAIILGLTQKGS